MNVNRLKMCLVGFYNIKDVFIVVIKWGNGEERSINMINKKKLFNFWSWDGKLGYNVFILWFWLFIFCWVNK